MTRAGYALGMSDTPSAPDYANTKALEGFMRHFDYALWGKYNLGTAEPRIANPHPLVKPQKLDLLDMKKVMGMLNTTGEAQRARAAKYEEAHRLSFWYTFP